ncbi:MAG: hypothetical protein OEX22_11210 [Cyclobacteriaceae bacterium]|nr:hypothetical protein [Cyclobacteriaceae bacterium]
MKKIDEKEIGKILMGTLLHQAPRGLADRIMAHVAVIPKKHLSIKPVEPNPVFAVLIVLVTTVVVIISFFTKPITLFYFHFENYFQFDFNPIWAAPAFVVFITIWGYVFLSKLINFSK